MAVLVKTGHWRTFRAHRPQQQLSANLFTSNHGRKPRVGLQHRAHPLHAVRTQAAAEGSFLGQISPGIPRRISSGPRKPQTSCAGPGPGPCAGTRLPAVPRDELWRCVLPGRSRFPSHRLHQLLSKPRSLRALQQPGRCRWATIDFPKISFNQKPFNLNVFV